MPYIIILGGIIMLLIFWIDYGKDHGSCREISRIKS